MFREALAGIAPALKFLPGGPGVVRRPGFAENVGEKVPGSIPAAARPSSASCLMLRMTRRCVRGKLKG